MRSSAHMPVAALLLLTVGCFPPSAVETADEETASSTEGAAGSDEASPGETPAVTPEAVPEGLVLLESMTTEHATTYVTPEIKTLHDEAGVVRVMYGMRLRNEDIEGISVFENTRFTDEHSRLLSSFPNIKAITVYPPFVLNEEGFDNLLAASSVEELFLRDVPLTESQIDAIADMRNLRHLTLISTGITDDQLQKLTALPLEVLSLQGNPLTTASVPHLAQFKMLERLTVTHCPLANEVEALKAALPDTNIL